MAKATKEKPEVQNDLFVAPPIKEKSAIQKVDDIKKGVGDLAIRMAAINIKTDDDYKAAVALGVEGGDTLKQLDKEEDAILGTYETFVKKVKSLFKAIAGPIKTGQDQTRSKCREWNIKQDQKRQMEIAKLAEKKAKEEAKIPIAETATAQVASQTKADNIQAKIEDLANTKEKETRRKRVVTIVDEKLIPREFLSVDMVKLNAVKGAVGTEIPVIAGVSIADELDVTFR